MTKAYSFGNKLDHLLPLETLLGLFGLLEIIQAAFQFSCDGIDVLSREEYVVLMWIRNL